MLGWGKRLNGGKQAANPPPDAAKGLGGGPEIVSGFPRGLPDGVRHRPLATARWPSEAETLAMLGEWKPGRFLIGVTT